jgi:Domain of unknown function (DUF4326)
MKDIINLHDYASKGEVTRDVGPDWQYMGHSSPAMGGLQGSALATPFVVSEPATGSRVATQHEATARYRRWLWQQITSQHPCVLDALRSIGPETVLACWCDPTPCYCQVIARAAAWLRTHETVHLAQAAEPPASHRNITRPAGKAQRG